MNITIAGYGFVGRAHEAVLKDTHNINIYDPPMGYKDIVAPDAVIICVSTPPHVDGSCNVNNVAEVISKIAEEVPILIKSTISLEGWRAIKDLFPDHQLAFSPEFLRAAHWKEDALGKKDYYFGGASCNFWSDIFLTARGAINVHVAKPEELILTKQLRNSYLALKVSFFNQVYDYCKGEGIDFETVRKLITTDDRIGESHSHVTDERGFGGHCLPKDTLATVRSSVVSADTRMTLLEEAIAYNNKIKKH